MRKLTLAFRITLILAILSFSTYIYIKEYQNLYLDFFFITIADILIIFSIYITIRYIIFAEFKVLFENNILKIEYLFPSKNKEIILSEIESYYYEENEVRGEIQKTICINTKAGKHYILNNKKRVDVPLIHNWLIKNNIDSLETAINRIFNYRRIGIALGIFHILLYISLHIIDNYNKPNKNDDFVIVNIKIDEAEKDKRKVGWDYKFSGLLFKSNNYKEFIFNIDNKYIKEEIVDSIIENKEKMNFCIKLSKSDFNAKILKSTEPTFTQKHLSWKAIETYEIYLCK